MTSVWLWLAGGKSYVQYLFPLIPGLTWTLGVESPTLYT